LQGIPGPLAAKVRIEKSSDKEKDQKDHDKKMCVGHAKQTMALFLIPWRNFHGFLEPLNVSRVFSILGPSITVE
jgi:hypothetical protein